MSDYRELVSILKELLTNRFYPKPQYIRGLLGDGQGNVIVPDRPDYNYVRFNCSSSETFEVFNKEVSQPVDGWPILIGELPWQPGLIQVVGTDWAAYSQTGWGDSVASIQAHAPTHEWPTFAPGSDPVNVYMRALTPLRTQVVGSGSNSVYVTPYEYDWTGTNAQWPGVPAMDFSAKPPTGSMLYMGVYLNPATNALGVVSGSTTVFTDALEPSIPNWPLGVYPSGYVRLYGGQAGITERDIRPAQRIYNTTLMFTGTSSGGGTGGNAWPKDGQNMLEAVDYATATLLIAAMSGGDIGYLGSRSSNESVDVNENNVIIQGVGTRATEFINGWIISGVGVAVLDLSVAVNTSGTYAIRVTGAPTDLTNVKALHADVEDVRAFQLEADTRLFNCEGIADSDGSGTPTARAVYVTNSAVVEIHGGNFTASTGTADEIFVDAGASVLLDGPTLTFGNFGGAGDVFGWYLDSVGGVHIVPGTDLTLVNPVDEFSTDGTLAGNSDTAVPTEKAVKTYVDANAGGSGAPSPIINGALQFWQRGTSFAAIASGSYSADKFLYVAVGAMAHTASQSADVPTVAEAAALIPYSLLLDCTTVDGSIAASDFCIIQHLIEGNFASSILQRQFTLSFWVKGTKTGIHCVSFRNQISDRSYVAEYTINTTATWEYKTITVSASPTAGTWNYTTGIGLSITWALACGSTYQTTAGTWQTGNFIATSGQVNACDSTSNDFRITGIRVDPGAAAVAFVLPDPEQEYSRCLRYCFVPDATTDTANMMTGAKFSTTVVVVNRYPPVVMRAVPVLTHNVTGYTAGNPTTTTVGLLNFGAGAYATITGALTLTGAGMDRDTIGCVLSAGTSWSGTAGDVFQLRIGPQVVLIFSSDL